MLDIGLAHSLYTFGDILRGSSQFEEENELITLKTSTWFVGFITNDSSGLFSLVRYSSNEV